MRLDRASMKEFGWLSGLFVPMGRIRHHGGPSHELDAPHPCGARPMDAVDAAHWWRVCQPTGLLAGQTGPRMWAYRWGDWAADAPHLEVSDVSHHGVQCTPSFADPWRHGLGVMKFEPIEIRIARVHDLIA